MVKPRRFRVEGGNLPRRRHIAWSKCLEKRHQIGLFPIGEVDPEALVVKCYDIVQSRRRTIVKIWGPGREATKDRTFDLSDIGTFSADHRAPKVGHGIRRSRKGPETQDTVKTGRPIVSSAGTAPVPVGASNGPALATPIFSGNLME